MPIADPADSRIKAPFAWFLVMDLAEPDPAYMGLGLAADPAAARRLIITETETLRRIRPAYEHLVIWPWFFMDFDHNDGPRAVIFDPSLAPPTNKELSPTDSYIETLLAGDPMLPGNVDVLLPLAQFA